MISDAPSTSSEDGDIADDDGSSALEHFLRRRVHPRKGTSKKLFPAHASKYQTCVFGDRKGYKQGFNSRYS